MLKKTKSKIRSELQETKPEVEKVESKFDLGNKNNPPIERLMDVKATLTLKLETSWGCDTECGTFDLTIETCKKCIIDILKKELRDYSISKIDVTVIPREFKNT